MPNSSDEVTLAVLGQKMDALTEKVNELHHTVCGNGKPGLKIEVDRLNERQKIRDWILGTVLVPLALTVIGYLLNLMV
jgi:hypothetical protein